MEVALVYYVCLSVTNYHTLGGLEQQKLIPFSGAQNPAMQVLPGPCCLRRPWGESLLWDYLTLISALEDKVLAQGSAVLQEMGLDSDPCDADHLLSVAGFIVFAEQGACHSQRPPAIH